MIEVKRTKKNKYTFKLNRSCFEQFYASLEEAIDRYGHLLSKERVLTLYNSNYRVNQAICMRILKRYRNDWHEVRDNYNISLDPVEAVVYWYSAVLVKDNFYAVLAISNELHRKLS